MLDDFQPMTSIICIETSSRHCAQLHIPCMQDHNEGDGDVVDATG